MWCGMHYHRVTSLMIGNRASFTFTHHAALARHTADQGLFDGFLKIEDGDHLMAATDRLNSCLVDDIGKISTHQAWRGFGHIHQVHIFSQQTILYMHFEDGTAALYIRPRHVHMTVKATGADQGRVEHVHAVGGGQHDHTVC